MGRIERAFADARARGRKVLVAYLCVGDPSVDESIALALACAEAGADVLELGSPFSDPTADGPAIARASERALARGGGLDATLRAARAIRARSEVPLVLFGYANPLYVRGEAAAIADAAEAGVDALLVVDLPLDEGEVIRAAARDRGLAIVPLVAPTSRPSRAEEILAAISSPGFVYYVSVAGVTGSHGASLEDASARAAEWRARTGLPTVVGFGVDSPDKARAAASAVDGCVVGTAIVLAIEDAGTPEDRLARVRGIVAGMRAALDTAWPAR